MLASTIKLATKYDYLEPKFKQAYNWLETHDATKLENGRYDICDGVFALVQRYTTVPFEKARFECHDEYFDIQYMAEGKEAFGVALREDCELVESDSANDCYFYKTPEFYSTVNIKVGDFVVIPPEEAHQPRAAYKGIEMPVVKVVVKIRV